jgi:hypothetical protein
MEYGSLTFLLFPSQEERIAELLFLPRKREQKKIETKGARVSRRILKQQQNKDAARELAGTPEKPVLLLTFLVRLLNFGFFLLARGKTS